MEEESFIRAENHSSAREQLNCIFKAGNSKIVETLKQKFFHDIYRSGRKKPIEEESFIQANNY